MSDTIIKVENLSKSYLLKHQNKQSYSTLRDEIAGFLKAKDKGVSKSDELFWALNDVSFDVKQGDRVGVIGRNGAGKSTLLKVLSRIVAPTKGRITIDGRIASLLEVGTGFHPELSGRENVFLNGAILGMSKAEIARKFDEIVAFAEVEKFLDTPVKRYSSGMYVRLAFAVAAHLEPEILIVDEVLAVGDAEFQKKCLGKMKDVSGQGRTVLFVSHNMSAIQNLCDKGIYLKKGEVQLAGDADKVIQAYLKASTELHAIQLADRKDRKGNGFIHFDQVKLKDSNGNEVQALQCGKDGIIEISFSRKPGENINNLHVALGIDDDYGQRIMQLNNEASNGLFTNFSASANTIQIHIPKVPLKSGSYSFALYSTVNNEIADWIQEAGVFEVEAGDFYNTGKLPPEGQGSIYVNYSFELK